MSLANPEKHEIVVNDNILIKLDKIGYEYAQQDSEASGNSEDGTMYREVIGLKNKVFCKFEDPEKRTGENLDNILYLARKKTHMMVNYYDKAERARVTKKMYFVIDPIHSDPCEIDDDFTVEPFEARFIQMTIDSVE